MERVSCSSARTPLLDGDRIEESPAFSSVELQCEDVIAVEVEIWLEVVFPGDPEVCLDVAVELRLKLLAVGAERRRVLLQVRAVEGAALRVVAEESIEH
jgi:hypothetical protein